jgi:hypothetical protein
MGIGSPVAGSALWSADRHHREIVRRVEQQSEEAVRFHPDLTPVLQAEDLAVHHAQGDAEAALRWIEHAYSLSPTGLELRVYESALFDRVRDDDFVAAVDAMRAGLWERVLRGTL